MILKHSASISAIHASDHLASLELLKHSSRPECARKPSGGFGPICSRRLAGRSQNEATIQMPDLDDRRLVAIGRQTPKAMTSASGFKNSRNHFGITQNGSGIGSGAFLRCPNSPMAKATASQ